MTNNKKIITNIFNNELIAPCGINCGVCIAYLREKKPCLGCRIKSENKPKYCITCIIANCGYFSETDSDFCIDCEKFPCQRMKSLDLRYRKKYKTSLIENQKLIKSNGIQLFLEKETLKWSCSVCGKVLSVHRDFCLNCKEAIK